MLQLSYSWSHLREGCLPGPQCCHYFMFCKSYTLFLALFLVLNVKLDFIFRVKDSEMLPTGNETIDPTVHFLWVYTVTVTIKLSCVFIPTGILCLWAVFSSLPTPCSHWSAYCLLGMFIFDPLSIKGIIQCVLLKKYFNCVCAFVCVSKCEYVHVNKVSQSDQKKASDH